ncbi:hypothetical protein CRENBAI_002858 [Crenichthys baileyi]|uniref:Uncharacterized protein n=1 Tax=Crenichthys baileyi TaxID=28760 RepID=A0AAV9SLS6_9TELE
MLKTYSKQTQNISVDWVAALPLHLQDDTELFYTCKEGEDQWPTMKRSAAIVSIIGDSEDVNTVPFHPQEVKVFLQEQVGLQGTKCWPDAIMHLYGFLNVIQAEYLKAMTYTFDFIQRVLLNVDGEKVKPKTLFKK